jgi:hypothetical protein
MQYTPSNRQENSIVCPDTRHVLPSYCTLCVQYSQLRLWRWHGHSATGRGGGATEGQAEGCGGSCCRSRNRPSIGSPARHAASGRFLLQALKSGLHSSESLMQGPSELRAHRCVAPHAFDCSGTSPNRAKVLLHFSNILEMLTSLHLT